VYPRSDLYALAATVLVLLTGTRASELGCYAATWDWRNQVNLSPALRGTVLNKMLSQHAGDRFQSARQVLQALTGSNTASCAPKSNSSA